MKKFYCLFYLTFLIPIYGNGQEGNNNPETKCRVYILSEKKTYANDSSEGSLFTNAFLEALESNMGDDDVLDQRELITKIFESGIEADTATHGHHQAGIKFELSSNTDQNRKNYALFFYGEEYDTWDNLDGISEDTENLSNKFKDDFGFEVESIASPTKIEVLRAIRKYTMKEYGPKDQLLVYFAGHGHFDDLYKWNYLVLKDSKKEDEANDSYMTHSQLLLLLNNIPVNRLMVVIDAGTQ